MIVSRFFVLGFFGLVAAACGGAEEGSGSGADTTNGAGGAKTGAPCTTDGVCARPFPYCAAEVGRCVECIGDPNCADGARCDVATHTCVECLRDGDCGGERPYCGASQRRCVECLGNGNCQAGEVCDTVTSTCRAGCSSSSECSGVDGAPHCAARGVCVQCTDSSGCTGDRPVCSAEGRCVECADDTACGGERPYCGDRSRCVECLTDLNCPPDERCDLREQQCTGG